LQIDPQRLADLARAWGGTSDLRRTLYAIERVLGVSLQQLPISGESLPSRRFRRIASGFALLECYARPAPVGWARFEQEIDWGLAVGSLRSTGFLLAGKYAALLRYALRH
jgi:hypothetical protein